MKRIAILLIQCFVTTVFANVEQAKIIGRVVLDKSQTMTCFAIHCPPSQPFFQLILDDAQIEGVGPVEVVHFQDFSKIRGTHDKPESIVYAGFTLTEGMYVMIEADVSLTRSSSKIYAVASNPGSIKSVSLRSPVMIY